MKAFISGNTTTDFIEREALATKKNLSANELHQTSTAACFMAGATK